MVKGVGSCPFVYVFLVTFLDFFTSKKRRVKDVVEGKGGVTICTSTACQY